MPSFLPLIEAYEAFLREQPNGELVAFGAHLLGSSGASLPLVRTSMSAELQGYFDATTAAHDYQTGNSEASYLVYRLAKFLKRYTKPVLADVGLSGQDEFAILADLDFRGEASKRELAEANLIDASSGVDMIRRLIRRGLAAERRGEDGRERLVSLTPAGKEVLGAYYAGFAQVPALLVELTPAEQVVLVGLLKRLDAVHTERAGQG